MLVLRVDQLLRLRQFGYGTLHIPSKVAQSVFGPYFAIGNANYAILVDNRTSEDIQHPFTTYLLNTLLGTADHTLHEPVHRTF